MAVDVLAGVASAGGAGRVNRPLVKALAAHGLLPRLFPARAGGTAERDVSALDLCLLREGLARGSTEGETALAMQGLGGYPILQSGREDVVLRWVPKIAGGEAVAAFALTEPGAGSDAAGVSGEPQELISAHPIGRLVLDGVHVPAGHVLGQVDGGFGVAMRTLDLFRPSVGAFAVGMAQAALDAALDHAGVRETFGKMLKDHQAVGHLLAEMATRLEAARLLVYAAAAAYDAGSSRPAKASAMAKLFATETAQFVVDAAIQIHGAAALERGHLLEHLYRDVRAPRIYEGATEIQREIVARELYRRPVPSD